MWRALFLAIGVSLCILGAETLAIEKAILANRSPAVVASDSLAPDLPAAGKEIVPPEWAPWSLLSAGAVVILYSFTIPRRVSG